MVITRVHAIVPVAFRLFFSVMGWLSVRYSYSTSHLSLGASSVPTLWEREKCLAVLSIIFNLHSLFNFIALFCSIGLFDIMLYWIAAMLGFILVWFITKWSQYYKLYRNVRGVFMYYNETASVFSSMYRSDFRCIFQSWFYLSLLFPTFFTKASFLPRDFSCDEFPQEYLFFIEFP